MKLKTELLDTYNDMLELKASLGYNKDTYRLNIVSLIEYFKEYFPDANELTKDMVDGWLMSQNFKTENTRRLTIINLRHFTKYINAIGEKSFVPGSDYNVKSNRFIPYIFSDSELKSLFNAIDDIKHCPKTHVEMMVPLIFRMQLCCGMRPNEPLNLKITDINLKSGDIFIRKTKKRKDRHIMMSEDMRKLCNVYNSIAGKREWFFPFWHNGKIPADWTRRQFNIAWTKSDTRLLKEKNPRPYDLRHNFATRTLMRWIDEKRDIMTLMPYLCEYMGHACLKDTLYYIHLLPEKLKKSSGIDWDMLKSIYPNTAREVCNYED